MKIENLQSQMRKGVLEYCILSILKKEAAYTSDIIEKLKEAELVVVEGTLYPLLTRLKNGGLLSYHWEESASGPPRKYYELSDLGLDFLSQMDKVWSQINHTVNHLQSK
jgi:PadR family transcriptional regulator PadR